MEGPWTFVAGEYCTCLLFCCDEISMPNLRNTIQLNTYGPKWQMLVWTRHFWIASLHFLIISCSTFFPHFFRSLLFVFSENEHGLARFYRFDGFPTFKIKSTIFSACCLFQCNCTLCLFMHGKLAKRVLCNHCLSPPNLSPSIEYNILQLYKGARKKLIYLDVHLLRHKLILILL